MRNIVANRLSKYAPMQLKTTDDWIWIDLLLRVLDAVARIGIWVFLALVLFLELIELDRRNMSEEELQREEEVRQWCAEYMPNAGRGECNPETAW